MWFRYLLTKLHHSFAAAIKSYDIGQITEKQVGHRIWKNLLQGRLTFVHNVKGEEMMPTFKADGDTLLVRILPLPSPRSIYVGDVVVFRDPEDARKVQVRRIAAMEGDEMVSTDENDQPFVLQSGDCWVLCDNKTLSPKQDAYDSRTFGPLQMKNIIGRAVYCSHSSIDHGEVHNSEEAMHKDSPVIAVELDIDELMRKQKRT